MEIIGYGILLAVGFYVAPFILTTVAVIVVGTIAFVVNLLGGGK